MQNKGCNRGKPKEIFLGFMKWAYAGIMHSNIFVGIVGAAIAFTSIILMNLEISLPVIAIMFLLVYSAYSFNRATDMAEDAVSHPERAKFVKNNYKTMMLGSFFGAASALLLGFSKNMFSGIVALYFLLCVAFYSIKLGKNKFRLKNIYLIKNVVVASAWSVVATVLPYAYMDIPFSSAAFFVFVFLFAKLFTNSVTFDLRDVKGDALEGIPTIPLKLGASKTIIYLTAANVVSGAYLVIITYMGFLPDVGYLIAAVTIYTQYYINAINKKNIWFVTDFLADGEYIFMCIAGIAYTVFLGSL